MELLFKWVWAFMVVYGLSNNKNVSLICFTKHNEGKCIAWAPTLELLCLSSFVKRSFQHIKNQIEMMQQLSSSIESNIEETSKKTRKVRIISVHADLVGLEKGMEIHKNIVACGYIKVRKMWDYATTMYTI